MDFQFLSTTNIIYYYKPINLCPNLYLITYKAQLFFSSSPYSLVILLFYQIIMSLLYKAG